MPQSTQDELSDPYRRYLISLVLFHLAGADEVGLTGRDHQAVSLLELDGPLTSGELAKRLALTTGATTRLIDRLVAADYARRIADPADRRRVLVEYSGRMPDELETLIQSVREPIGELIAGLTDEQRSGVQQYIQGAGHAYAAALHKLRQG